MNILNFVRWAAWVLVAVLALGATLVGTGWLQVAKPGLSGSQISSSGVPAIGGPYTMTDHLGRRVNEKTYAGKPQLVFFGFTHCPDVCPTTLLEISEWLKALGSEADRLQPIFVTMDPERDSPEALKLYLESFDPRIVALTGTREEVEAITKAYKAYARKNPKDADGGYTIDHTSVVYLMHSDGTFTSTIDLSVERETAVMQLRRLLREE